jgi:four helix bundle protein
MLNTDQTKIFENRLKQFTLNVVRVTKLLSKTEENKIFVKQLLRSSSSIGANYAEALFAQTRQEFLHCISISRKEASIQFLMMS